MKWDSSLYDEKHQFVTKYGGDLLDWLDPKPGERILDIGCGTGHLTARITEFGAKTVGLDSSAEMIETARRNHPRLEFIRADAAEFTVAEPFDAIFSNAALHWVHRAEEAIVRMAAALRPGGRFVVEFGGKGNIEQILAALEQACRELTGRIPSVVNYFPSIGEYTPLLERHGIEALRAELFDRPTPLEDGEQGLENWLRMFRPAALEAPSPETELAIVKRVEELLRDSLFRDGTWYADYRRLRIVGVKQSENPP
jgi:trans-aconitate methyltransferase